MTWAYRVAGATLDEVSDALDVAGVDADGISEEDGVTTAWFASRPTGPLPLDGRWEQVDDADWAERWKEGLTPVTVGRITVSPPWLAPDGPALDPDGPIVLVVEPGMAFGTGHHETTTSCLAALQSVGVEGRHVVDVGTGTGVLALAARALGASGVRAVDVDPEAVQVARANLALHDLDGIELAVGSCAEAGDGDVVVANIITDLLLAIAEDLVGLVRPGGVLIASGVSVERVADAVAAFSRAGMAVEPTPGREWAVLVGRRPT